MSISNPAEPAKPSVINFIRLLRLTSGEFVTHQEVQTVTVNEAIPPVSVVTFEVDNYVPVASQVDYAWIAGETYVIG